MKTLKHIQKVKLLTVLALVLAGLASCSGESPVSKISNEYVFAVENQDEIESVRAALTKRFERLNSALIYTVTSEIIDDSVHIRTYGPKIDFNLVQPYIFDHGSVKFISSKYLKVLSNKHIQSARYSESEGQHAVFVELTDEGHGLLSKWINNNLGKELRIEIDNKIIFQSVMQKQLGKRFAITNGYTEADALIIALYLNSPELRSKVYLKRQTS